MTCRIGNAKFSRGSPDFDGDGSVGILDLVTLLANWGDVRVVVERLIAVATIPASSTKRGPPIMSERQTITKPTMYCRRCRYVLDGLSDHRCPECGRPFDPANRQTYRTKPRRRWLWKIIFAVIGLPAGALIGASLLVFLMLPPAPQNRISPLIISLSVGLPVGGLAGCGLGILLGAFFDKRRETTWLSVLAIFLALGLSIATFWAWYLSNSGR